MTEISFDMSEVSALAARVPKASAAMVAPLAAVVETSAQAVEKRMRSDAKGHDRFPYLPAAITHDTRGLVAEIGPDKNRRGGAIGNIVYFGTINNGPVLPHPSTALEAVRPAFEAAVAKAAGDGLEKGLGA